MKRNIYLEGMPLPEAQGLWNSRLRALGIGLPAGAETVAVAESLGRVTAAPVAARISSPFYHAAAMDGYAVRFIDTFGASERDPVRLRIGEQAVPVDTGDPIPDGFNAVIMIEEVSEVQGAEGAVEIIAPATPWQHVRTIGEDIVATELIVPENHRIRPVDVGALLAGGHAGVLVRKKPVVAIIPTGNEVVEPGSELSAGNIIESNSRVIAGLVREWGGEPVRLGIVPDDQERLILAIEDAAANADIVVVNAGSSAGTEDYTGSAIRAAGEVVVHGVGIKPGKPVILGVVRKKPVLGIPGYPVSTYITVRLFLQPLLSGLQGLRVPEPEKINAVLSRQIASPLGQEEFVRVKIGMVGDRVVATPVGRGAGVIMSLVRADGILRIPAMSEGMGAGTEAGIELLRPRDEIRNTIVCIGSHDNAIDILANFLKRRFPEYSLSSAHVGSMGGLIALKRGEAHLAGTHLLDEESGLYNTPFLKRLLPEKRVVLVNLVYREQGLVVRKGNPKGICGFRDLIRGDVEFINRQAGSGTRLLTDKHLRELGIEASGIRGYDKDEYTHMGVASAVLTGMADTGLAILAAARALGLDFIPVAHERYDLAIPGEFLETGMIRALLSVIREDRGFRDTVLSLGGYDVSDMGTVMHGEPV